MPASTFQAMISSVGSVLSGRKEMNSQSVTILFAAMICILAPLDISQLGFALVGAIAYAILQTLAPRSTKTNCQLAAERGQRERQQRSPRGTPVRASSECSSPMKSSPTRPRPCGATRMSHLPVAAAVWKPDVYKPSSVPIIAPKFASTGWEAEVCELVSQLTPGAEEEQAVQRLVQHVKRAIQTLFPEVEVTGFAHSSLACGKAFGVAVPELDIVANISPHALAQRLQQRSRQLDLQKVLKTAVRTCTDQLVSAGGFKFRRSAFRGDEPKVTLLVPSNLGFFVDAIPMDFSINAVTPFYSAALLTECGQIERRAKELMLLVKRWAKDRGICHAAKGHLSPYLWGLLVMYFLQVNGEEEGPLLPTFDAFKISSMAGPKSNVSSPRSNATSADSTKLSTGQLFCKFVEFYSRTFNWNHEAVSIRLGKRAPPALTLPVHVILREDGSSVVGPSIEDPFKTGSNLGTCMNAVSLERLRAELARGDTLCTRGASLTEMLEPWVPEEDAMVQGRSNSDSPAEAARDRSSSESVGSKDADQVRSIREQMRSGA